MHTPLPPDLMAKEIIKEFTPIAGEDKAMAVSLKHLNLTIKHLLFRVGDYRKELESDWPLYFSYWEQVHIHLQEQSGVNSNKNQ